MKTNARDAWVRKALCLVMSALLCLWLVPLAYADDAPGTRQEGAAAEPPSADPALDGDPVQGGSGEGGEEPAAGVDPVDPVDPADDPVQPGSENGVVDGAPVVDRFEGTVDPQLEADPVVEAQDVAEQDGRGVSYSAHVRSIGWQSAVTDGGVAGTTGRSLRVEALRLSLTGVGAGSIVYSAYAQGKGWLTEVSDGQMGGTTGEARQIEAVKISLTGEIAQSYDVYYRVHAAHVGWLDWAMNGAPAGTGGYEYALEAVQVQLVKKNGRAPGATATPFRNLGNIVYRSHVSNVGWQSQVADGDVAGTTGRSLAMEALQVKADSLGLQGDVVYAAHVASIGWQDEVKNGDVAGTTGRGLRMEAVKIRLTDELEQAYDVYYRVHAQNFGWLDWASNGAVAGTTGLSFRIEALQVELVAKGGKAPGATARPCVGRASASYMARVQGVGWQSWCSGGSMAGTTGQALPIEALQMKLNSDIPGGISYRLHVQDVGWQSWSSDGAIAGTVDRGLRAEAVSIKLTGEAADYYDVYYRAHSEAYGWLGWAKNGAFAGTSTCSYRLEAVQVVVVGKGGAAPGSTSGAYRETPPIPATHAAMNSLVKNLSSPTGWLLAVDSTNCLFGVYRGSQGNWTNVAMWSCSPGKASTPTVKGLYSVGMRGYSFGSGFTCYYWTQFYGDYLIHSEVYYQNSFVFMEGVMGVPASHGCVRLPIDRAKWVYDTIPTQTTVYSY